jgi:hypothetical protein
LAGKRFFSGEGALVSLAPPRRRQPHAAQDHRQLRWVDPNPLFTGTRRYRLERAFLEPLVPEHVPVAIPPQRFDSVTPLVDEQEQAAVSGIATERAPDDPRDPLKLFRMSVAPEWR